MTFRYHNKGTIHDRNSDKLDFIEIKNSCYSKDNVNRMIKQATDWETMSVRDTSHKELLSKMHKEHLTK